MFGRLLVLITKAGKLRGLAVTSASLAACARTADDGRIRPAGIRAFNVVRLLRTRWNAAHDCRQDSRRYAPRAYAARHAAATGRSALT